MFLYEYSSDYYAAEEARFGDVDSENEAVLEMCREAALESIYWDFEVPEDLNLEESFPRFVELYVSDYIESNYWDVYERWAKAQSDY